MGIIGPNGAGKSTLFRMLAGREQPDAGSIKIGETVDLSYVDQDRDDLDPDATVYEEITGGAEVLEVGGREIRGRAYVSSFNFKGTDHGKRVGDLSGGGRNRVHLAKLLKSGGNVLLLDRHPRPRVRGRQPGALVRGQLLRVRGVPQEGTRRRHRRAPPHQVQEARRITPGV